MYTYTLINPTKDPLHFEDFLLVTDEAAFPCRAGDPAAPPGLPCHLLPRAFLDPEAGRRAVIFGLSRHSLPSRGEIDGLSYATGALPTVGHVVLHRPAEAEREALLEKALHRGKVPTEESFLSLRRRGEVRVLSLVPQVADGKGWALWDRFEKDLRKVRSAGWIPNDDLLTRLLVALKRARKAAETRRTDLMIEHLRAMGRIPGSSPEDEVSPEARGFIAVMASSLSTTLPKAEALHLRLTAEKTELQEGEVAGFEARLERWMDGKACKDVGLLWKLRDPSDGFVLDRKETRTGPDGRSKVQFQIRPASSVEVQVATLPSGPPSGMGPSSFAERASAQLRLAVLPGPHASRKVPLLEADLVPLKPAGDGEFLWPVGETFEEARRMVGRIVLVCEREFARKGGKGALCTPVPLCVEKNDEPTYFLKEGMAKPFFRFSEKETVEEYYPILRREGGCVEVLLNAESGRTAWIQLSLAPPEDVHTLQVSEAPSWESNPNLIHSYEPQHDDSVYPIDPFYLTGRMWRRIYAQPDLSAPWMVLFPCGTSTGGDRVIYLLGRERDFLLIGVLGKYDDYIPLGWIPLRDAEGRLTVWDCPFLC